MEGETRPKGEVDIVLTLSMNEARKLKESILADFTWRETGAELLWEELYNLLYELT